MPVLERARTDEVVVGAGLAALTLGRGTLVTVAVIAATMGLPVVCLGYSLIRSEGGHSPVATAPDLSGNHRINLGQ